MTGIPRREEAPLPVGEPGCPVAGQLSWPFIRVPACPWVGGCVNTCESLGSVYLEVTQVMSTGVAWWTRVPRPSLDARMYLWVTESRVPRTRRQQEKAGQGDGRVGGGAGPEGGPEAAWGAPGCLGPLPELGPVGCVESPIPTPSDQRARLSSTRCLKLPWAPGIRRLGKLFRCFSPLRKWEAWPHSAVGSDETSCFREMGARWAMGGQCRGA